MRRLAVINCKKMKMTRPAKARDMYAESAMFRAQRDFVEAYYDAYVILSTKHGVCLPDDIIEPYNLTFHTSGYAAKDPNVVTTDEGYAKEWTERVGAHSIWGEYDHIDLHIAADYYKFLPDFVKAKSNKIALPPNIGFTSDWYRLMLRDYRNGITPSFVYVCTGVRRLSFEPQTWYHPTDGQFTGTPHDLCLHTKNTLGYTLDQSTVQRVAGYAKFSGRPVNHTKGWHLDPKLTPHIKFLAGRWQVAGSIPTPPLTTLDEFL